MITKLARLEFERFTKPSNFNFLQVHQALSLNLLGAYRLWLTACILKKTAGSILILPFGVYIAILITARFQAFPIPTRRL